LRRKVFYPTAEAGKNLRNQPDNNLARRGRISRPVTGNRQLSSLFFLTRVKRIPAAKFITRQSAGRLHPRSGGKRSAERAETGYRAGAWRWQPSASRHNSIGSWPGSSRATGARSRAVRVIIIGQAEKV